MNAEDMQNSRPLAILGGTFDPIHLGHLRAAWEAAEHLDAEVRLLPARAPPHRAQPVASANQRLALIQAALAGQTRLCVDERELHRDGFSYTVDTLHELRGELGTAQPLILLLGADAFAHLSSWHCWRELFTLAHIGVLTRPGHGGVLPAELESETRPRWTEERVVLRTQSAGYVHNIPITPLEISASRIRAELNAGRDPYFLMPESLLHNPMLLAAYR